MGGGDRRRLGLASIPKAQIGSYIFETQSFYYVVLALFAAALLLQHRLVASDLGLRIRAMKHSEIAVSSVGINVYRLKVLVFVISAAFAEFGGTLFAHQQNYISPDNFQFFSSVFFLLAVLFGGGGTLMGPVIGATVLTLLPELLHDLDKFRLIVYGCFILATLYFLPNGVMGLFERRSRSGAPHADDPVAGTKFEQQEFAPTAGAALEVRNVSKSFGGVRALHQVSFRVAPGSIHALIGPNGAGKTTLVNLVSGFYRADDGQIVVDGRAADIVSMDDAARRGIVRTFQTIKLFGDMTVLEHVVIGFARHSRSSIGGTIFAGKRVRADTAHNLTAARDLIALVGLSRFENSPASALAYGHRRLLEIARALAVQPKVLLLDEPAAGLVAEEISALADIILELRGAGVTVLLIEHHIDLVVKNFRPRNRSRLWRRHRRWPAICGATR